MSHEIKSTKLKSAAYKSTVPDRKKSFSIKADQIKEANKWHSIFFVSFLIFWVGLSVNHGNLFLREALLCSTIILVITFLKGADHYNDPHINN